MAYQFDWVDAFTTTPFGGNACVVVHDADQVSLDDRMRLVRETSLSECSFIVASEVADFGARYYLAEREILMAGHPTIATVASMLSRGIVEDNSSFTLEVGAGVLPIEVKDGQITMTQAKPSFISDISPASIARIYGLSADDIVGTPQIVSTGTPFCIVVLKSKEAQRRAVLNEDALFKWRATTDVVNADTMEPFLVTLGGEQGGDTFARLLLPAPMPPEDPFTGSATGCMGAYLWENGLIPSPSFVAEQGNWMGRPGQAFVEVLRPPGDIEGVRVSGSGVVLMSGELKL